jgi:hypothetical protein
MTWLQTASAGNTNLGLATIVCGQPGALNDPANTALKFSGNMSNDVEVPYGPGISPSGSFSVELWVKGANVYGIPISMTDYNTPTASGGWYIAQTDTNLKGPGGFYFRVYVGGSRIGCNLNMTMDPNAWYHIVGVFNGSQELLYTNGVLAASGSTAGSYTPPTTPQPLRFGQYGSGYYAYDGLIDEPAFYKYALSAGQIAAHYAAATTNGTGYAAQILADHPAGYWRFNETFTPPTAQNSSTVGAPLNGAYYGPSTTAVDLDGPTVPGLESNNRVLQVTTNALSGVVIPSLNFTTNTVTFECLIKPKADQVDALGNPTLAGVVVHRNQLRRSNACGINFASATTLGYCWNVGNVNGNNTVASTTDFGLTPPEGSWSYVALAISPTSATMYMYDGTNWSSAVDSINTSFAAQTFDGYTCVGFDYAPTHNFNGSIDEVAIYNKTLTQGQLNTHALAAFGGLGAPVLVPSATAPVVQSPSPSAPDPNIYAGAPFTLSMDAIGAGLAYQWEFTTDFSTYTIIPGATNSTYTKPSAMNADTGYYGVIISNATGTVTSDFLYVGVASVAFPNVNQPVPAALSVYPGGSASFTASSATGGGLGYQWQQAGTNLPGATTSTLALVNVTAGNSGNYTLVVTNAAGSVTSTPPATLSVVAPPSGSYESAVLADAPEGYWRLQDTGSSLTIFDSMGRHNGYCNRYVSQSTNGLGFLQPGALAGESCYSMYFDGQNHVTYGVDVPWSSALNAPVFSAECWVLMGNTNYYVGTAHGMSCMGCRDDNGDCAERSRGWYLNAQTIINSWSDYMAIGGENGTGGLDGGQWSQNWSSTTVFLNTYANWTHLVCTYDGTINRLYVNGVLASSNTGDFAPGLYRDLYIGSGDAYVQAFPGTQWTGNIEEAAYYPRLLTADRVLAHYELGRYGNTNLPIIALPPASQTVNSGAAVALSPLVIGAPTISYQWKLNGTNLPGATSLNLSFASASLANAGSYALAATNSYGGVVSPAAILTVLPPPVITITYQIVAGSGGTQNLQINYAVGNLYSATNVAGPWTAVSGATAPSCTVPINPATPIMFFRVK